MLKKPPVTVSTHLKGMHPTNLDDGGYKVEYAAQVPPTSKQADARLIISPQVMTTGQAISLNSEALKRFPGIPYNHHSAVLSDETFSQLLFQIWQQNLWGKSAVAHVLLRTWDTHGRYSTFLSNPCGFNCPVRPVFRISFPLGDTGSVRLLGKLLKKEAVPYDLEKGALLRPFFVNDTPILLFHGNKLVTAASNGLSRSMNCITFVDTALGLDSQNVSGRGGAEMAQDAGADEVLSGASGEQLSAFFDPKRKTEWGEKSYIFW
ncbi:hypothetical protein ACVWXL_005758 [Bradyrhizobium sp. GM22.5]